MKTISGTCAVVSAALLRMAAIAAESESMCLYSSPACSLAWSTLSASTVDIALTWPSDATTALISVKDAITEEVVATGTATSGESSWRWTVFPGDAPDADRCFAVSAVYRSDKADLSSETAILVLNKGTFAPVDIYSTPRGLGFAKTPSGRAVAYSSRWFDASGESPLSVTVTERTSGAESVFSSDSSVNGYFLWCPRKDGGANGWYDFLFSCGGESIAGRALLGFNGTRITVR